jgi:hypothetical protein
MGGEWAPLRTGGGRAIAWFRALTKESKMWLRATVGTIMGPCENATLSDKADRVLVDFDSKGLLNVWKSNILGAAGNGQVRLSAVPFAVPFAARPFASSPLPPQGHERQESETHAELHAVVDVMVVAEDVLVAEDMPLREAMLIQLL